MTRLFILLTAALLIAAPMQAGKLKYTCEYLHSMSYRDKLDIYEHDDGWFWLEYEGKWAEMKLGQMEDRCLMRKLNWMKQEDLKKIRLRLYKLEQCACQGHDEHGDHGPPGLSHDGPPGHQ